MKTFHTVVCWLNVNAQVLQTLAAWLVVGLIGYTAMLARVAERSFKLTSDIEVIKWLEEIRSERRELRDLRKKNANAPWTAREEELADSVIRRFDLIGFLQRERRVKNAIVERIYAGPICETAELCEIYLNKLMSERGPVHFWEFRKLVERMKLVRHPATTGQTTWPERKRD